MNNVEEEIKREASIPVQSRVDIRTLATMVEYFELNGIKIRSMSMLLSYSVELAQHLLDINEAIVKIKKVAEAHQILESRSLYQPGMKKRGREKIFHALSFENMRYEGIDPKDYAPQQFSMVHNKHSVEVPTFREPEMNVESDTSKAIDKAFKKIEEEKLEEVKKRTEEAKKNWKLTGEKVNGEDVIEVIQSEYDTVKVLKDIEREKKEREEAERKEEKAKANNDAPRTLTDEEYAAKEKEREDKDRAYEEKLRNM